MAKNVDLGPILVHLALIWAAKFPPLQKIWLRQSLEVMVSYHHVQYQKRLTDGQTDESDFIGRCPTNVERPIKFSKNLLVHLCRIGMIKNKIKF